MDISSILRAEDRDISSFIAEGQPHKSVLLVEGARQVGKTSSVLHALDQTPRLAPWSVTQYDSRRRIVNLPAYLLERLPELTGLAAGGTAPAKGF